MDYGKLIRDAWAITWRYRFLWLLGLLAGGSAGLPGLNSGGGGGGRTEGAPAVPADLERLNPALAAITQLPGFGIAIAAAATIAMIGLVLLLSIVVAFAQRAIAVENVGPIAALRSGWSLMRAHLGDSLMTWLINVGLTLACAVACLAGVVGLLVVIGGIGAVVYAFAGFTAPTIAYMRVGSIVSFVSLLPMVVWLALIGRRLFERAHGAAYGPGATR